MIKAAICTIGDEILIGQIVDTNSAQIAHQLNKIGVKVVEIVSIADEESIILEKLNVLCKQYEIVITTGGLGPTKDDKTKSSLYILTNSNSYNEDSSQLEIIKSFTLKRGEEFLELNRLQASIPDNCNAIPNIKGTAPGIFSRISKNNSDIDSLIFSLPGVPYEMDYLLPYVLEIIKSNFHLLDIYHKTVITFGIPESLLSNKIEKWENNLPSHIKLAYLPNPLIGIKLRLSIYGCDVNSAKDEVDNQIIPLKEILGDAIYGENNDTLEIVIRSMLLEKGKTLSIAESCTGGQISSLLTKLPGISKVFVGGIIAYSNNLKVIELGVSEETISKFGAVSEECSQEMAQGVRKITGSDFSLSVTGIAGPDGGSIDKPVGTAWISISYNKVTVSKKITSLGDRQRIIERVSAEALNFLRLQLMQIR